MAGFLTEWERPELDSVPSLAENMVYLLPACPDLFVRKALQEAYRDFCRRSAALRTWRKIELGPGVGTYPVAPVLSGEIDCVTRVLRADGTPCLRGWSCFGSPPTLRVTRFDFFPGPALPAQAVPNVGVVDRAEAPCPGGRPPPPPLVFVEAVEIPSVGEERAPRPFLKRYGGALVDGALARLFSMQGRAWTDAEQASQRAVAYENAVSEARLRCAAGGPSANAAAFPSVDMGGMV